MKKLLLATLMMSAGIANALEIKTYSADEGSFSVQSTLVMGEKEAILVDSGFTRADAMRIAANILDSQKTLTTILVSQADPDYYFGAATLKEIFPDVKVVTSPAVLEKIKSKVETKLSVWSPRMGENAPKNVVIPEVMKKTVLTLDGEKIELRGTTGELAHRPYVWIPSLKMITGNVGVFNDMHLWLADTQTVASRQAWLDQLDEMIALNPEIIVAGHSFKGKASDKTTLEFNKAYLQKYEQILAESKDSSEVIAKMKQAYPTLGAEGNLGLGAKVNKGEMKW